MPSRSDEGWFIINKQTKALEVGETFEQGIMIHGKVEGTKKNRKILYNRKGEKSCRIPMNNVDDVPEEEATWLIAIKQDKNRYTMWNSKREILKSHILLTEGKHVIVKPPKGEAEFIAKIVKVVIADNSGKKLLVEDISSHTRETVTIAAIVKICENNTGAACSSEIYVPPKEAGSVSANHGARHQPPAVKVFGTGFYNQTSSKGRTSTERFSEEDRRCKQKIESNMSMLLKLLNGKQDELLQKLPSEWKSHNTRPTKKQKEISHIHTIQTLEYILKDIGDNGHKAFNDFMSVLMDMHEERALKLLLEDQSSATEASMQGASNASQTHLAGEERERSTSYEGEKESSLRPPQMSKGSCPLADYKDKTFNNGPFDWSDQNELVHYDSSAKRKTKQDKEKDDNFEGKSNISTNTRVKVKLDDRVSYGTVKWIGYLSEGGQLSAGVEMDEQIQGQGATDGKFRGEKKFDTGPGRGMFLKLAECTPLLATETSEIAAPVNILPPQPFRQISAGFRKGIEGRDNSCYMDSTIFCLFAFNAAFDKFLQEIDKLDKERKIVVEYFKENVVNALRGRFFVDAEKMQTLRGMLMKIAMDSDLIDKERDPEEFLRIFFQGLLKAEPFFTFNTGEGDYMLQILCERDRDMIPTTQKLLNKTFVTQNIKLKDVPKCFILQLPRSGTKNKVYDRVFLSPYINMAEITESASRECINCQKQATKECSECEGYYVYDDCVIPAFCKECFKQCHKGKRGNHGGQVIKKEAQTKTNKESLMELLGVLCIETSHYVAFAKTGADHNSPWVFFDSMADRVEDSDASYNIPRVRVCEGLNEWMTEEGLAKLRTEELEGEVFRFFTHPFICFYRRC